jgi:hypothetical protein
MVDVRKNDRGARFAAFAARVLGRYGSYCAKPGAGIAITFAPATGSHNCCMSAAGVSDISVTFTGHPVVLSVSTLPWVEVFGRRVQAAFDNLSNPGVLEIGCLSC